MGKMSDQVPTQRKNVDGAQIELAKCGGNVGGGIEHIGGQAVQNQARSPARLPLAGVAEIAATWRRQRLQEL